MTRILLLSVLAVSLAACATAGRDGDEPPGFRGGYGGLTGGFSRAGGGSP